MHSHALIVDRLEARGRWGSRGNILDRELMNKRRGQEREGLVEVTHCFANTASRKMQIRLEE